MRCPFCQSSDTVVRDSRPAEDDTAVRRRRFCQTCAARFTTFERVQLKELIVVKRGGKKAPFERDKLAKSVKIALQKRPVSDEQIDQLVSGIVRRLESVAEGEVPSKDIGGMVMEALQSVDPVGYVRYASVYRDFRDPSDFARFIDLQFSEGEARELLADDE